MNKKLKISWPEKIEMDFYGESTLPYNQTCIDVGWNKAIDACQAAVDAAGLEYGLDGEK